MIVAIEGPDCCGKTTLWNALRDCVEGAKFVPRMHVTPALFPYMRDLTLRDVGLWEALYDPTQVYICDRSPFFSAKVYDRLYGREPLDLSKWDDVVRVLYVRVPIEELRRRYAIRGDDLFDEGRFERLLQLYEEALDERCEAVHDVPSAIAAMGKFLWTRKNKVQER